MKTLGKILAICLIVLTSCSDNEEVKYSCTKGTIRILNKERTGCARGGGWCAFKFYLFDGKSAYWCETDNKTYDAYNINDTLPTLVISKRELPTSPVSNPYKN